MLSWSQHTEAVGWVHQGPWTTFEKPIQVVQPLERPFLCEIPFFLSPQPKVLVAALITTSNLFTVTNYFLQSG